MYEVVLVPTAGTSRYPTLLLPSAVQLDKFPALGVPISGVVRLGLVPNTSAPEPVSPVTAVARLALEGVPRKSATPEPNEVMPVPPFATGRVPVTPVVKGSPVVLVSTPEAGVPRAGGDKCRAST